MERRIPLFWQLEIETRSTCNRTCAGCLRNSHPDREAVAPWFEDNELPTEVIHRLFREAQEMGFRGAVCLQHYNEPLHDSRIADLGATAMSMGFQHVFTCTNADYLNERVAESLDGRFHQLIVAVYVEEPHKSRREEWVRSLFSTTEVVLTHGEMIPTHFSPLFPVTLLSQRHAANPCWEPIKRMIVNHRGDMLMCCDDMVGHFDLGNVYDHSLEELWFSERHQDLLLALEQPGGRSCHAHCLSCPRP